MKHFCSLVRPTRASLTNAEKGLGSLNAGRFAKELERDSTISLLQYNPKRVEVVTFQSPKNIGFGLANQFSLKPSRFEADFQTHHVSDAEKARNEPALEWILLEPQ
jgi:hypothetical protein